MKKIKFMPGRRAFIRLAGFALAALTVLSVWLAHSSQAAEYYAAQSKASRLRSLAQLSEHSLSLSEQLEELIFAQGEHKEETVAKAIYSASAARQCLSEFPDCKDSLSPLYSFYAYAAKAAADSAVEADFSILAQGASLLTSRIENLAAACLSGALSLAELPTALGEEAAEFYAQGLNSLGAGLPQMKDEAQRESVFLSALPAVCRDEAAEKAAEILGLEPVLLRDGGDVSNPVELYRFRYRDEQISVTKRGGLIYSITLPADADTRELESGDAAYRAENYLQSLGFSGFKARYYRVSDNICTVCLHQNQNGIFSAKESVWVKISLEDGSALGMDAGDYLLNRREHSEAPSISEDEARLALPKECSGSAALVIVESSGEERLCYEFVFRDSERVRLFYIDASSGALALTRLLPEGAGIFGE